MILLHNCIRFSYFYFSIKKLLKFPINSFSLRSKFSIRYITLLYILLMNGQIEKYLFQIFYQLYFFKERKINKSCILTPFEISHSVQINLFSVADKNIVLVAGDCCVPIPLHTMILVFVLSVFARKNSKCTIYFIVYKRSL